MALIKYIDKRFTSGSVAVIATANEIIEEYGNQGYTLTLRQLYYQFVARDLLPNTQRSYKRLGSIVSDARLAGLIDWSAIEDRTRFLRGTPSVSGPAEAMSDAARDYHIDWWKGQEVRPEVWIEKDALIGVIESPCGDLDVDYFACRGYVSQSELWRAGLRMRARYVRDNQRTIVFHLGDHDPSGIDMTRDITERLAMFAQYSVEVVRLALNMDQVTEYNPPPNPTKMSDSRALDYVQRFGENSWELDALEPSMIEQLVTTAVEDLIEQRGDPGLMENRKEQEGFDRNRIEEVAEDWD